METQLSVSFVIVWAPRVLESTPVSGRREKRKAAPQLVTAAGAGLCPPRAGPAAPEAKLRTTQLGSELCCFDGPQQEASVLYSVSTEFYCWISWPITIAWTRRGPRTQCGVCMASVGTAL